LYISRAVAVTTPRLSQRWKRTRAFFPRFAFADSTATRGASVSGFTGTVGLSGAAAALPFSVHTSLVAGSCAKA
jgi:hypothetical protein